MELVKYNEAYRRSAALFGLQPDRVLAELVEQKGLTGHALDLGAGDGRNSLYLARRGLVVEALELSIPAVTKLNQLAEALHLPIQASLHDIRERGLIAGPYDLVVADTVLCHLTMREAREIATEMTGAMADGAWLYASSFATDDPRESEFAPLVQTYFETADFCGLFSRLEHERCANVKVIDRRHGAPHRHSLLQLVAQKPGTL